MSTSTTRAVEAAMRLADENKLGREDDEEFCDKVQDDYEIVARELTRLRAALDEIDVLNPEDFMGPAHVSPAFRSVDFPRVFKRVCEIVNKVLHNTDAYGNPLSPEEKTDV